MALLGLLAIDAAAEDASETLVVTGTRAPHPLEGFPGSVEVITREDWAARPLASVGELLRHRAGLHFDQPGGAGSRGSLYLRGLDPNHTLVLLDGIAVNDPGNARGGSFDWQGLGLDGIERIEIVRGPLSAVHGSDALAGAIRIVTADGRGPDRIEAAAAGGRFGAWSAQGAVAGERGIFDLRVGGGYEDDGSPEDLGSFRGAHGDASLGVDLGPAARLRAVARLGDWRSRAFPEFSGGPDLATLRGHERRDVTSLAGGVGLDLSPAEWLDTRLLASTLQRREQRRSPGVAPSTGDSFGIPAEPDSEDRLRRYDLSAQATLRPAASLSLSLGGEIEWLRGDSRATLVYFDPMSPPVVDRYSLARRVYGVFAEVRWSAPLGAVVQAGVRGDYPDDAGAQWTPRVGISWPLPVPALDLELHGSWGLGYKLPSFFALANPVAGNPDLQAEHSEGWDAGLRGRFLEGRVEAGVTGFGNRVRELIDFDLETFRLENLDRVTATGVELELSVEPLAGVWLRGHATWVRTRDRDGEPLRNRPEWRGGGELDWAIGAGLRARIGALVVGDVLDASVPTAPAVVELDAWGRVDASLEWSPREGLALWLAVENLLDADYEEAVGFPSLPIRPGAGLRLRF